MENEHIASSVTELIGKTPLLRASRFAAAAGISNTPLLKLEYLNPAGSVKDRAALKMIEDAEKAGKLKPGAVIVEPTSGNTGIGLASIAAARGYRVVLTMPETMSAERRKLLSVYGAEIVLTPGKDGMRGAIEKADEIAKSTPGSFIPAQFENPSNPAAHYETTGPELVQQTDGNLDIFVAGIGANFIPKNYDASVVDEVLTVTDEEAYKMAKLLARTEGILVGITSGAALAAAVRLLRMPENAEKTLVALLPDSGDRYFSTPIFE